MLDMSLASKIGISCTVVYILIAAMSLETNAYYVRAIVSVICAAFSIYMLTAMGGCSKKTANTDLENVTMMYERGMHAAHKRSYTGALAEFAKIDEIYPYSEPARKAQIMMIFCNYMLKNYEDVNSGADVFERLYPFDQYIPYVTYLNAIAFYQESRGFMRDKTSVKQARLLMASLGDRFPDSQYVTLLSDKLRSSERVLYLAELDVARQHLYAHDYVAATQRLLAMKRELAATHAATNDANTTHPIVSGLGLEFNSTIDEMLQGSLLGLGIEMSEI